MRRGGYGKPWRQPADGWGVPPKAYLGGLYQHQNTTINWLPALENTTEVTLQPNQVGPPVTRYTAAPGGVTCESHPTNGLPPIPWVGPGANQLLPGTAVNTFELSGTVSFGMNCRRRGGKWVQAVRQWHGAYGFTSHDPGGCADTQCASTVDGVTTYRAYESYQPTPDQTKYLGMSATCTLTQNLTFKITSVYNYLTGGNYWTRVQTSAYVGSKTCAIQTEVNASSGMLQLEGNTTTNSLTLTQTVVDNIYGNSGPTTTADSGMSIWPGLDPSYCVEAWTANCGGVAMGGSPLYAGSGPGPGYSGNATTLALALQAITGAGGYSGFSVALTTYTVSATQFQIVLTMTPPGTSVETGTGPDPEHGTGDYNYTITTAITGTASWTIDVGLSGTNTAASVYADVVSLLGNWDLTNDAQYPPRTDGVWQVAPLMSRDEQPANVGPVQFPPASVNDLRNPLTDANGNGAFTTGSAPPPLGWTYAPNNNDSSGNPPGSPSYGGPADWVATYSQVGWFDPNAFGFTFPAGYDASNSAATALVQFALTGAVLGAPNPAGYQDYFDFRAQIWAACNNDIGGASELDWYLQGYGQWLSDAIAASGAQLPLNATQWTNYFDAYSKPPFAYLMQGDAQIYATPPDTRAHRADALWAQKCVVFPELWPSYDFFRPAGADRFLLDEKSVCFVSNLSSPAPGGTFTSQDYTGADVTLTVPPGSVWGGASVGGFYNITVSGSTVTLGSLVLALPPAWASRSGDTDDGFGRLRFPSAPAILGRDAVSAVTNNGDGTVTLTLAVEENWLLTGDHIDLFSTTLTYDGAGNRVSEAMTSLAANLSATVVDTTHVNVTATYGTIAGTQYIMSHGAPDWSWDDNGRKGDWVYLDWTFDYRTNGEAARLGSVTDCAGNTPPAAGVPATNYGYAGFTQTQHEHTSGLVFRPCCPMALCISPNGETFTNGTTVGFPATFTVDGRYGARWQAEIEEAMADLLWQAPHIPYGGSTWNTDDGTCQADGFHYAYPPLVEARISVPSYGGNGADLTAPTPPTGIGYLPPVTNASGLGAPGMIGFDPASGKPAAAWTTWGYRLNIEATCGTGCAFNYVDAENLPCVSSYAPAAGTGALDLNTDSGNTGEGVT